ncbi:PREDICTED: surfeit locus protein 1 [Ceratosolen solmsi marchali]|uniref:SURF1-like protein n=1 Tax=Ceratosolen solmsi marchali TaxID=326594 RepID=A0AAJ6YWR3_9HYME|nr:PREDICTED: surfeit locus protein 1 [Ceratosolen solmsi marchali]
MLVNQCALLYEFFDKNLSGSFRIQILSLSYSDRYPNKNYSFNTSKRFFLYSLNNISTLFFSRSCSSRQIEISLLKSQNKDNKQKTKWSQTKFLKDVNLYSLLLLSFPVISFGLGIWQLKRRKWKLDLIRAVQEKFHKPAVGIPENLNDLALLEYHPIKVSGEFLYNNEFVIGPRTLIINGQPASEIRQNLIPHNEVNKGYNIITPFKVKDRELIILVNRGWIPNYYNSSSERKKFQIQGSVEIIGINRLTESKPQFVFKNIPEQGIWTFRDVIEMAKFAKTQPVYLEMTQSNNELEMPIGSQTRINFRNEHTSYIVTWFTLSICTAYFWYTSFIRKKPIL